MKIARKISTVCICIAMLFLILNAATLAREEKKTEALANTFLRLHVRASSDSPEDQALKLKVRDRVLSYTSALLDGATDKEDAKKRLAPHLGELEALCRMVTTDAGMPCDVSVSLCRERFDYREYDGFFLPEGDYDALIVTLGEGKGHNWWCVVFPAVCLSGATGEIRTNTEKVPERFRLSDTAVSDDVRYDLWIVRVIRSWFR